MGEDSWQALTAEHHLEGFGVLWWRLVVDVCRRVAPRYPEGTYNNGLSWDQGAIEDLAQDVIASRLLSVEGSESQLDYVVLHASTEGEARRLIKMHVRQVLDKRVVPNQRDNIADRLFGLFEARGEAVQTGEGMGYRRPGTSWEVLLNDKEEQRLVVGILLSLPRLPNLGTERNSPLFTTEVLMESIEPIWAAVRAPVTKNFLLRALDHALTGWMPRFFCLNEEFDESAEVSLEPEEQVALAELSSGLVRALSAPQREILCNVDVLSDTEVARRLGVSRQTALKKRHDTAHAIENYLIEAGVDLGDLELKGRIVVLAQERLRGFHVR